MTVAKWVTEELTTLAEHAEVLRQFNAWRRWRGDDEDEAGPAMPDPRQIGLAIDAAIACMEAKP